MKTTFLGLSIFLCASLTFAQDTFYVNSQIGNDSGDGTVSAPWKTIEKARDTLRAQRAEGKTFPQGVVVEMTGTFAYPMQNLEFTAQDGGTAPNAPVVYRASKEGALFVGGSPLKEGGFRVVEDTDVLDRLRPEARGKVVEFDLNTLEGVVAPELPIQFQRWPGLDLYSNDRAMQIARFPNEGWIEIPEVVDRGVAPVDRSKDEWEFGVRGAIFKFDGDEPLRWDCSKGIWVMGFWCHDWYIDTLKLASIDREKRTFTTEGISRYGVGNHSAWHTAKRRYYVLNLLEELDRPGEWYIDREKNVLYFYPVEGDLKSIVLAVQRKPVILVKGAKFFHLDGLEMKCTLTQGIQMTDCEDSVIENVFVHDITGSGVSIAGGHRNRLESSEVCRMGAGGVSLYGGNRKTLEKCDNAMLRCHIHHCGRLQRTSGGYCLTFNGCGCYVAHNLIHDTPYICIGYGGNEHLFEFNEVHSAMMESGDGGGMYSGRDWGSLGTIVRNNYFHHFGQAGVEWQREQGLAPDYQPLKESIMVMGVYLDDCDCGDTVQNNVFYRTGWSAFVGGGRYNKILNNLFIECTAAVHFDDRGLSRAKPGEGYTNGWDLLKKIQDLGFQESPWKERYPFIQNIMEDDPKLPLHNSVRNNVAIACPRWLQMHGSCVKTSLPRIDFTDNHVFNPGVSQVELFPKNADGSIRTEFRTETLDPTLPPSELLKKAHELVPTFEIFEFGK